MEPLAFVIVFVAVVVVFFGVRAVVRHDRHAEESAGQRSAEDLKAEDLKAREEIEELHRKQHPSGFGF
jgi:uncharacterized membrane protein